MIKVTRWITLGALFIIPTLAILPFVSVANNFFFPFITGKNFAFRILVEIAFVGWALLALVDKKYRPKFSWVAAIFGVFVVWMAIADSFGMNPAKAFWSNFERMDGWVTLIHLFMLFVVMGSMFSVDKLWRKWWGVFLGVSACVCVYSFGQLAGILAVHQGGVRLDATFGNSDYLACFLLFAIAISIWQAFEAKAKWLKYGLFVFAVVETFILLQTATRGAILGLIGAIGLGALLWAFESGNTKLGKAARRGAGAVLLVLLIAIGGFYLARNTSFIQHDPSLSRLATISLQDPETHTRLIIWHMALEGAVQKPILGWGQEGFNYVFNTYYQPVLYDQEPWFDRAHNMYLDWLVAGGIPALLLFLALLGSTVFALYRNSVSRPERILLLSALAAYCFQGFFVFDNLFSYMPLVAILAIAHGGSSRPIKQIENAPIVEGDGFNYAALPIAVVVLLVLIWVVNVPSMRAAGDIITAITPSADPTTNLAAFKQAYADGSFADQEITEQLATYAEGLASQQGVSPTDLQTVFTYAATQMQALVIAIPNDARIRLEAALLFRSGGDYPDALAQIHVAEQLSPNKQSIMTEEGIEDWESGNYAAADAAFQKAYLLDTSFTDLAAYAAGGDIVTNQIPAGKALLQQAFGTTTVDQDILVLAYYQVKDYPDLIAVWQKRVVDQDNSATAEFGLAEAYADAGENAAARAEIQTAITAHPEAATEGAAILSQISSS
jgi:O-antigen ligase/tetratricopeptide (TPR) repeat protein